VSCDSRENLGGAASGSKSGGSMADPVTIQNLRKMEDWQIAEVADQCAELYGFGGTFACLGLMVAEAYREIIELRQSMRHCGECARDGGNAIQEAEADLLRGRDGCK
jgi:hypothetical protein